MKIGVLPGSGPTRLIVVGGLSLVVLTALWWFFWVPAWRPPLEPGERYGIDVSAHQDEIDWHSVAQDDIDFAYIKATEGGDFIDNAFDLNWRGAADAGLERGTYHFFTLCTPGTTQAENFLSIAAPDPTALAPAIDLELAGNCSERPPTGSVRDELDGFLDVVEQAWDREAILYVGQDWLEAYPTTLPDRPLWLRRFLIRPDDPWLIWQLHGYARVEGIEGGVDLDVMRDE